MSNANELLRRVMDAESHEMLDDVLEDIRTFLAAEPEAEPVAYRHLMDDGWEYYDAPTGDDCDGCEPLYSRPPKPGETESKYYCARSHPHEEMSKECELRTQIAYLQNALVDLKPAEPARKPMTEKNA